MLSRYVDAMFGHPSVVAFAKDADHRYVMVSDAWTRAFDRLREDVLGRTSMEVFGPGFGESVTDRDQAVLDRGVHEDAIQQLPTSEAGRTLWFLTKVFPIRDPEGAIVGVGGIALDITERQESREALEAAERRYRTLVEHGPDGYVELDVTTGRFVDANDNFARLVGRSREDLLQIGPADMSPEVQPDGEPSMDRVRELVSQAIGGEPIAFRWVHLHADGTPIPFHVWLTRLHHPERPRVAALLSDLREVEAREAELRDSRDALARQKRMLDDTQAVARLGGWEADLGLQRFIWTDQTYRLHGLEPGDLEPGVELLEQLYPPDTMDDVWKVVQAAVAAREPYEVEATARLPDGSQRVMRYIGQVVEAAEGRPARLVGTVQDVTERRSLEAQLRQAQKLEGLGRLAGGIAHDFNNLLTVIQGSLDYLQSGLQPGAPQLADLADVRNATARARDLAGQLLTFASEQPTRPRLVRPGDVVRRIDRLIARLLGEDVELQLDLAEEGGAVLVDPAQLEQVIVNMVANARDALPRGGRVRIETADLMLSGSAAQELGLEAGPYVRIRISDDGEGMSPEVRDRVFEPFFTSKEPGRGTGLGLSVAYGIVRQTEGAIELTTAPGEGARFDVWLPLASEPPEELPRQSPTVSPRGTGRLLLLEDDRAVRRVTRRALQRAGFEVLEAATAEEALAIACDELEALDLLVSDVVMPGTDGFEVADAIHAIRPDLPVLFVSGYALEALRARGHAIEPERLLPKPFTPGELVEAVNRTLESGTSG